MSKEILIENLKCAKNKQSLKSAMNAMMIEWTTNEWLHLKWHMKKNVEKKKWLQCGWPKEAWLQ